MSTSRDYVPAKDTLFADFEENLYNMVLTNQVAWSLPPSPVASLGTLQTAWQTAWAVAKIKHTRTPADVVAKNNARALYEPALREFVSSYLLYNSLITDAQKAMMGLTIHSSQRQHQPPMPNSPTMTLDKVVHLQQTLKIVNANTPDTHRMPTGQKVLLQYFIGNAGITPTEAMFNNTLLVTRFLTRIPFVMEQVGQTIYYRCCYINSRKQQSPFSEVLNAVIW